MSDTTFDMDMIQISAKNYMYMELNTLRSASIDSNTLKLGYTQQIQSVNSSQTFSVYIMENYEDH